MRPPLSGPPSRPGECATRLCENDAELRTAFTTPQAVTYAQDVCLHCANVWLAAVARLARAEVAPWTVLVGLIPGLSPRGSGG